jgi:ATP-dependent Clp protease ATP-binding subunit ClpA
LFERFTDRARRVVVFAEEEARMLNHDYTGTEHLLLGLIHDGEGVAAKALESLHISLEAVRQQVEEIVGRGQAAPTFHILFTPRARKVLEFSLRESLQLGHNYIGTEHILLGLIREGEGVAARILENLGSNMVRVRRTVMERLVDRVAFPVEMPTEAARPPDEPPYPFDEPEKIVLSLLLQGETSSGIAEILGTSKARVGEIIQAIVVRLGKILGEDEDG